MKNVLGVNGYNNQRDGEKFIVKRLSGELDVKREALRKESDEFQKTAGLPAWLTRAALIALPVGLVSLLIFFAMFEEETPFYEAFSRAGWLFCVSLALIVLSLVLFAIDYSKRKRAKASPAFSYLKERVDRLDRECYAELGVPENYTAIDVAALSYRKKGGMKDGKVPAFATYVNADVAFYADADAISFAFTDCVFAIPRDRILGVRRIDKKLCVSNWTKEEPYNKGRYKNYKIRQNNGYGIGYIIKPYYIVVCRDENYEEYHIIIPCYDAEPVIQAIGKPVE